MTRETGTALGPNSNRILEIHQRYSSQFRLTNNHQNNDLIT